MIKSGGPEQARQTEDSCFELVGSRSALHTMYMYAQADLANRWFKYLKVGLSDCGFIKRVH